MSWNPVLNKFVEIKEAFIAKYGKGILWNYKKGEESCLEYWARMLGDKKYEALLSHLQFSEKDDLLLLRYADFWNVDEEESTTNFWDQYDGFYRECRSVTIDAANDELVHVPFRKFFNLNEADGFDTDAVRERIANATSVEFSNKLDGSMMSARHYKCRTMLASARSVNKEQSWRLADAKTMFSSRPGYEKAAKDFSRKTFIYEYISLKDAHLVNYKPEEEGLYLIGIRDVDTGEEASYKEVLDIAERYDIPTTVTYETSLDKVLSSLGDKKSNEAEGFVLNVDGLRVKIKYDDYVQMHCILSKISTPNAVIRAIGDGVYDDFISKVPAEYKPRVTNVANKVFTYIRLAEKAIKELYAEAPKNDKKTFAIWVSENVPKVLRPYVMAKYTGEEYNLVRKHEPPHAKYPTIGEIEKRTTIVERCLQERNNEVHER